jgi:hypothetical protein
MNGLKLISLSNLKDHLRIDVKKFMDPFQHLLSVRFKVLLNLGAS